jgi:hypothetical protein
VSGVSDSTPGVRVKIVTGGSCRLALCSATQAYPLDPEEPDRSFGRAL